MVCSFIEEGTFVDDYTVVKKDSLRITVRITSTDGRAIPNLEELFHTLHHGGCMVVTAEKRGTESVGLFIGDLHFEPASKATRTGSRSWFSGLSLPWRRRVTATV
ncbi:hypothetical protein HY625_01695 [Candidatus Uhrbacteria bacterium]|nr:hypothetical protein [Candidatus Uhrbacteria bacterium]